MFQSGKIPCEQNQVQLKEAVSQAVTTWLAGSPWPQAEAGGLGLASRARQAEHGHALLGANLLFSLPCL